MIHRFPSVHEEHARVRIRLVIYASESKGWDTLLKDVVHPGLEALIELPNHVGDCRLFLRVSRMDR